MAQPATTVNWYGWVSCRALNDLESAVAESSRPNPGRVEYDNMGDSFSVRPAIGARHAGKLSCDVADCYSPTTIYCGHNPRAWAGIRPTIDLR